jgi:hypothetical protein
MRFGNTPDDDASPCPLGVASLRKQIQITYTYLTVGVEVDILVDDRLWTHRVQQFMSISPIDSREGVISGLSVRAKISIGAKFQIG